ncbi:hypothetical protein ACFE04_021660 [Oxalis oulophora]
MMPLYRDKGNRRRSLRNRDFRDVEKALNVPIQYKNFNCKIPTLKVVLVIIMLGGLLTLFRSPAISISDHPSSSTSRSSFVPRWITESVSVDQRYKSTLDINWDHISEVIDKLTDKDKYQGIGLLNFNDNEHENWKEYFGQGVCGSKHLNKSPKSAISYVYFAKILVAFILMFVLAAIGS